MGNLLKLFKPEKHAATAQKFRKNALITIHPYLENNTWVFDDETVGLVKESFVLGVPEMIEFLVEGWICPALFCYYEKAPENLYIKIG